MQSTASPPREYGAVFTKRWMVEMMLDVSGYTPDRDLAHEIAHEPAVGAGAFLLPMVERLSESCRRFGHDIEEATNAIRAWDLQTEHVDRSRAAVTDLLAGEGWDRESAQRLASAWIVQGDYLLRPPSDEEVDFVIGNPPYIRAESIPRELRGKYIAACDAMTAGTDIFVGFVERGLRSLRPNGVLSYICADRWMHNVYGRRLRRLVAEQFSVEAVLKMHGVDAFAEEVSAYPAVTVIRRSAQGAVLYAEANETFDERAAARLTALSDAPDAKLNDADVRAAWLPTWFRGDGLWPSGSPSRLELLEQLEEEFRTLEDIETGTKIGIGIATGADRVFITSSGDVVEEERLLPLVKGEHLRTGRVRWVDTWLVNPWSPDGSLVDLDDWPRLREYLENSAVALKQRHVAKRSMDRWYRTIDKVNSNLTGTPKLLFQDMKRTSEPVLDRGQFYPHHNLYWVTSEEWDLRVLGGILLSRVAQLFVESYAVRMRGGTLRFQAQYLRKIRVPRPSQISNDLKADLAAAFDCRDVEAATAAAMRAYGIESIPV